MSRLIKVSSFVCAFIIIILGYLVVSGDNGLIELNKLKEQRRILAEHNSISRAENIKLWRMAKRLKHDPVFVAHVARNEMGMISKGEIILKLRKRIGKADE